MYYAKCGCNNTTADRCYEKQNLNKQNLSNRQERFSGFAVTATSNGSMIIVIDCGCRSYITPDKSLFKTLSRLEEYGSAMFITNGDGTQQQVHGVGEICLTFYDRNKAKYMFNLQRIVFTELQFSFDISFTSIQARKYSDL